MPFAFLSPAGEATAATLLDRFTLTVAPSATAWLRGHTTQAATVPSRALLLSSPQFPPEFPPLSGADAEAEKLRTMLKAAGSAVTGASGRAATETFLRQGWGQFDLVHLATHGELNPASPLESRILLSPGEGHDGNLRVGEVLSLPQARGSIQLVVLSACETGKIGSYDEDVTRRFPVGDDLLGLTRAFAVAGARAVLASYWKVDDEATAVLIQSFYRHWLSAPAAGKAAALRQAQLEVRKSGAGDVEDGWDLPYYWSAFALHGDGR